MDIEDAVGQRYIEIIVESPEVLGKNEEEQVDLLDGTAFGPSPAQILADIQVALAEFSNGMVFEIENVNDLLKLIHDNEGTS